MQKIILIFLGVGVAGAGLLYVLQGDGGSKMVSETQEVTAETSQSEVQNNDAHLNGLGSFMSLLALGSKIECTFDSVVEGYSSEGVFYTDGIRFRVEATSEIPEQGTQVSNIINDGSYTYVWGRNGGTEMAIKMPNIEPVEGETESSYVAHEESDFDLDENVNYDCNRWSVDEAVFTPPAQITFMDMETMMQDAMQGMPEGFELPEGVTLPEGFEMPS